MSSLDRSLALLLRGGPGVWTSVRDWSDDDLFTALDRHGITALISQRVQSTPAGDTCPPTIRARLKQAALRLSCLESLNRRELQKVLASLDAVGVRPILFKGTALAYAVYPRAVFRERNDTDLLVEPGEIVAVEHALAGIGYRRQASPGSTETTQQALFRKPNLIDGVHDLDVHWGICNRPLLKDFLTFRELAAHSEPLTALHSAAMGPSRLHALLIAAVHRVAHHNNGTLLGWLYDIDLLTRAFARAELEAFRRLADEKGVSAISATALMLAMQELGCLTAHREWVEDWSAQARTRKESTAIYLTSAPWAGDQALSDFATLPGWAARLRFLREIVWPAREYMFDRYGVRSRALLPLLHLRRLTFGMWNLVLRLLRDLRRARIESLGQSL